MSTLWRSVKPVGYWTVPRGQRFGYVASIGLPITNHFSPITLRRAPDLSLSKVTLAQGGPLTFHFSPFANPLYLSHLTNHFLPLTAAPAVQRFQDLFLILSQRVDLGLLSITAAFRAPGDLKEILGSGFEMIRISQCKSARVFCMISKWRPQNAGRSALTQFRVSRLDFRLTINDRVRDSGMVTQT
jgi:hypothetical protein